MSDYELGELQRQQANTHRIGTIAAVDAANARVQVNVAGLTTDWLPWTASRAGATRAWSPPSVGEQVLVASPYGDLAQGVVLGSIYQDAHPAPASSQDQETVIFADGAVIDHNSATHALSATLNAAGSLKVTIGAAKVEASASSIKLTVGGIILELTSAGLAITGGTVTHNGKNIGATHTHSGVQSGGSNTGAPV